MTNNNIDIEKLGGGENIGQMRKRTSGNVRKYKDYFIVQNPKTKEITHAPIELVDYKTLGMVEHYRGDLAVKEWLKKMKKL